MTQPDSVIKAKLWSRGILSWKLRPEQKLFKSEIENANKQLIVGNISRRWGKSFTLVLYAIEQALKSKQKIRYAAAFKSDLEEFILPAFEQILEDCPEHLRPRYIASKQEWRFPSHNSVIKLVGLDKKPNGLRGNAINIIILDEAGFISGLKAQYTTVIIPATAKQSNIKIIVISTPPESPEHFFVDLITKAQTQPNGYYLCLTIDDISDLDPTERKRLLDEVGGEHSVTAQREFFCVIRVDATKALAPEFNQANHVKDLTKPEHAIYYIAGDTGGVRDFFVFHLCTYDFTRDKVLFLDERAFPSGTASSEWVAAVKEMEGTLHIQSRWIDAPGAIQIDLMSAHKYPVALPRKDEMDATNNQVRLALHQNKIEIDPKCKLLIRTLKGGTFNSQRTDLSRTPELGHMDAYMSCAYGLRMVNKNNPYPAIPTGQTAYTFIPAKKPTNNNATALGQLAKGFK